MADIYTERGLTQTSTVNIGEMSTGSDVRRAGKIFDAIEEHAQQKANKYQKLATELYKGGSNLAIQDGLETLSRDPNYSSNPEAFAKEADKMASKVYSDIQNPEIKADVILNYELKKNAYVNKAYSNYYRKQNAEKEYQVLSGIDKSMNRAGVSLENIMVGDFTGDDLFNIDNANKDLEKYINAKDEQGFDLFTPREKMSMKNAYEQNMLRRLKGGYVSLPFSERERYFDKLSKDELEISFGTDEEGNQINRNIKDFVPEDIYLDFRDFVLKTRRRAKRISGNRGEITREDQAIADTQELTNEENQRQWSEIAYEKKSEGKSSYPNAKEIDVLSFRQKLQDQLYQNLISEEDFVKSMDKTIPVMESLLEEHGTGKLESGFGTRLFEKESAIQGAVDRISGDIKTLAPKQKMFLIDTIYNQLANEGLLDQRYHGDYSVTSKINAIADNAIKTWLENQIPGLPDTNANAVLRRGHIYNYIKNPNPVFSKHVYDKTRSLFVKDGIKYYEFTAPNGVTYSKRIIDE